MSFNPMPGYFVELYKGTPAEIALEPYVAALSVPYRTQLPLWLFSKLRFFPDFAMPTIGWVIEVDDEGHLTTEAEDQQRTLALEGIGYRVVRCTNEEALHEPQKVMLRLAMARATHGDRNLGIPTAPRNYAKKKKGKKPVKASPPKKSPKRAKGFTWNSSSSHSPLSFSHSLASSVSWLLAPRPSKMTRLLTS